MLIEKKNSAKSKNGKVEIHIDYFEEYIKWRTIAIAFLAFFCSPALILFGAILVYFLGGMW